jgi:predicted membrane protein
MESQQNRGIDPTKPATPSQPEYEYHRYNRSGRTIAGLIIVVVGVVFLARQLGADLPWWLFTWPMFLIVLGIFIGAKHNFRDFGWLIPVAIGLVFLADDFVDDISLKQFFWPVLIIVIGLVMMLRPRKGRSEQFWKRWEKKHTSEMNQSSDDLLECVTIFGGVKKNIISKDFKGGEVITFFGGTELNLTQADVSDKIVLELVQVFGGTKLIVPPHWRIQTDELVSIFGGLNDKRSLPAPTSTESAKVLILKGTCIFGGIDIKSY